MEHEHPKQHEAPQAHDTHSGHTQHLGHFRTKFLRSLILALPILLLSPIMGITLPFQIGFQYADIVVAVLASLLLLYGGQPFFQGAVNELKHKSPGMMALVSLGISVSYLYSVYAVIARYLVGHHVMDFFFEFSSLILIMLVGHWIEMKAVGEAGDALKSLAALLPKDAQVVLKDDRIERRPVNALQPDDLIRVQAGENIPADGIVEKGTSHVNEALLTGESSAVPKKVGDRVIGGSTNNEGVLYIRVTETGEQSFIAQVQSLIREAQSQPSRSEDLAHKVAASLFYIALIVAVIAFFVWLFLEDLATATSFAVTTLVIACPHALGLAIPLVVAKSTSLGAHRGLLVKNREALARTNKVDIVLLDKTGTLTTGELEVFALDRLDEQYTKKDMIALVAGMEQGSSHPIAQSILNYAKKMNIAPQLFDSLSIVAGKGMKGTLKGKEYELLSEKAYGRTLDFTPPLGATLSVLTKEGKAIGYVALGDEVKENSIAFIQQLKSWGITPLMATGDNDSAARKVADKLDIDYLANQSPQDKYALVERLKQQQLTTMMVGDGVNDGPALALADIGVAIGAGTQIAIDSADIILTRSDPGDIEDLIELSKKTTRKMKENLLWGAGYNFIAIPLAAGILVPVGISLSPAIGAILMSMSTAIVAVNAMLLKLNDRK